MRSIHKGGVDKKMMTQNNLFTFIRKYGPEMEHMGCPPPFYRQAFDNIDEECTVAASTLGVKDWKVFADGFSKMLLRVRSRKICWYYAIPSWIGNFYPMQDIFPMQKRLMFINYRMRNEQELMISL